MSLGVFRANSLGEALQFVNSLSGAAEILEVSPMGKSALVLLQGNLEKVDWSAWGTRAVKLDSPRDELLSGYLSYDNAKISKFLAVFESSEPAQIFKAAQDGLTLGMHIVDFRVLRTEGSPCYLLMTADSEKDLSKFGFVKATAVKETTPALRQFFDVSPQ